MGKSLLEGEGREMFWRAINISQHSDDTLWRTLNSLLHSGKIAAPTPCDLSGLTGLGATYFRANTHRIGLRARQRATSPTRPLRLADPCSSTVLHANTARAILTPFPGPGVEEGGVFAPPGSVPGHVIRTPPCINQGGKREAVCDHLISFQVAEEKFGGSRLRAGTGPALGAAALSSREMLKRRRVFSVEPLWNRDGAWKPLESSVVLTSVSMYRNLQDPPSPRECSLKLELGGKISSEMDRWGEAGSPTELAPHKGLNHQLGFIPTSGRLLKSESEDSGVEMASGDHSPSTPVDSEKSFTLDCVDSFQSLAKDPATVVSHNSSPEAEEHAEPDPGPDRPYHRNLSISKKLAQVVQRSQKHRLPGRSSRQLSQRPRSLLDLERLKAYCAHRPASVDGVVGAACGGYCSTTSGCNTPVEQHMEAVVQDEPSLTMPGQGLRYLEHICQMLEKIAQLQRANQRLQYQHQIMECRLRAQESENDGLSEETPEELRLTGAEPPPGSQAATEMEESPHPPSPYCPQHFRARSASDTHLVLSPAHHSESRPDRSGKAAAHFSSSPSLLDQPDGGSRTLPPGMKLKNEHSHWGKVKVLINRMKRKSVRANEQTPFGEAAPSSRWSRLDDVSDKQELHPRRRFLPTLGAKKRQSQHLPMR